MKIAGNAANAIDDDDRHLDGRLGWWWRCERLAEILCRDANGPHTRGSMHGCQKRREAIREGVGQTPTVSVLGAAHQQEA